MADSALKFAVPRAKPTDPVIEEAVAFLRKVESFGTVSFAARRLHLSRDAFLARLASIEAKVGARLMSADGPLLLTRRGRRLLGKSAEP